MVTRETSRGLLKLCQRMRKGFKLFSNSTDLETVWKRFRVTYSTMESLPLLENAHWSRDVLNSAVHCRTDCKRAIQIDI